MEEALEDIIKQGENQEVEFKASGSDLKEIAKSVTAFSNTNGGYIFIGISNSGKISGLKENLDKAQKVLF